MFGLNPARARLLETFGLDAELTRGDGCRLFTDDGTEYLDFLSQYGALPFGHNPPQIWDALKGQHSAMRPAMVQPLRPVEAERLAETLARIAPHDLDIVMFANSGAEAVEAAIKLARARTGRDTILSTRNSFHGKTMGALSATGKPMYQKDFGGPAPAFAYVAFGDLAALEAELAARADQIAAFIVEPIQGEGGVVCPPEGYLDAVIALCRAHGVLCIVDEIQTGLGRTGQLFACSDCPLAPDMLLLGKALGGGLMPVSAVVIRPEAWDDRFGTLHSSTFANSNLACAAALAAIDLLLRDDAALIATVAENGAYLQRQLQTLIEIYPDVLQEVRGRGYMQGLIFRDLYERGDSGAMAFCGLNGGFIGLLSSYLFNVEGVLTAPVFNNANVMRLQPPLIAGRAEIDRCVAALTTACDALDRADYRALMAHLLTPERQETLAGAVPSLPQKGPARDLPEATPGRFCFLIHYTEEEDVLRSDPSFARLTEAERAAWLDWVKQVGPGFAWPVAGGTSKQSGASAEGMIMSVPLLPRDMVGKGRRPAREMIQATADMAVEYGASRLGLGAFTSIVTNGGAAVAGRGVPVTSGNTLTTVAAVQALQNAADRAGIDITTAHVAIVGATGAIGRLASLMISRWAGRLTLVGNAQNCHAPHLLDRVANDIVRALAVDHPNQQVGALRNTVRNLLPWFEDDGPEPSLARLLRACAHMDAPPIATTTDLDAALESADLVLVATNADIALVDPARMRPGTVVCDVARPPNVAQADLSETGVVVFDGGLVSPPFPVNLGPFQTLPEDLCWGCMGETMLLALEGETRDYSLGRDLSLEDADRLAEMAARHGFAPAPPQWHGSYLEDADFDRVKAARSVEVPAEIPAKSPAEMPAERPAGEAAAKRTGTANWAAE